MTDERQGSVPGEVEKDEEILKDLDVEEGADKVLGGTRNIGCPCDGGE